jgi:hypothetical protein
LGAFGQPRWTTSLCNPLTGRYNRKDRQCRGKEKYAGARQAEHHDTKRQKTAETKIS